MSEKGEQTWVPPAIVLTGLGWKRWECHIKATWSLGSSSANQAMSSLKRGRSKSTRQASYLLPFYTYLCLQAIGFDEDIGESEHKNPQAPLIASSFEHTQSST